MALQHVFARHIRPLVPALNREGVRERAGGTAREGNGERACEKERTGAAACGRRGREGRRRPWSRTQKRARSRLWTLISESGQSRTCMRKPHAQTPCSEHSDAPGRARRACRALSSPACNKRTRRATPQPRQPFCPHAGLARAGTTARGTPREQQRGPLTAPCPSRSRARRRRRP